jgi:hypothetical protein
MEIYKFFRDVRIGDTFIYEGQGYIKTNKDFAKSTNYNFTRLYYQFKKNQLVMKVPTNEIEYDVEL